MREAPELTDECDGEQFGRCELCNKDELAKQMTIDQDMLLCDDCLMAEQLQDELSAP